MGTWGRQGSSPRQSGQALALGAPPIPRARVNLCRRSLSYGPGSRLIPSTMWVVGPLSGSNGPSSVFLSLLWFSATERYITLGPALRERRGSNVSQPTGVKTGFSKTTVPSNWRPVFPRELQGSRAVLVPTGFCLNSVCRCIHQLFTQGELRGVGQRIAERADRHKCRDLEHSLVIHVGLQLA